MARIGIWIPFETEDGAKRGLAKIAPTGLHGDVTRLKEKDRTGPSLRERVAAVEAANADRRASGTAMFHDVSMAVFDRLGAVESALAAVEERLDSHRERLAAVEDFTTELRNAEDTTVHRIGNLEADFLDLRTRIGDLERDPAPVRPEPGSVAEDPDRLAKVAPEPTDDVLLDLFMRAEYAASDTRAARRAIYNLGCEHGRAERDAIAEELSALKTALPIFHNCPEGVDFAKSAHEWARTRDAAMNEDRAALLARAEKAERAAANQHRGIEDALRPYRGVLSAESLSRADDIRDLVGEWQKRGDFLARIANGARAVSTAELLPGDITLARADGRMFVCPDGTGCVLVPVPEEPAAPSAPRDPLADPQPGDWFVDTDWDVLRFDGTAARLIHTLSCVGPGGGTFTHTIGVSYWLSESRRFGRRPMTPAEVAAFQRDGTRPTAAPSEAEMAAELESAGWMEAVTGWADTNGDARDLSLSAAHAAMRAAKGAR